MICSSAPQCDRGVSTSVTTDHNSLVPKTCCSMVPVAVIWKLTLLPPHLLILIQTFLKTYLTNSIKIAKLRTSESTTMRCNPITNVLSNICHEEKNFELFQLRNYTEENLFLWTKTTKDNEKGRNTQITNIQIRNIKARENLSKQRICKNKFTHTFYKYCRLLFRYVTKNEFTKSRKMRFIHNKTIFLDKTLLFYTIYFIIIFFFNPPSQTKE